MTAVDEGLEALNKYDLLAGVVTEQFVKQQKAVTEKIKSMTKSVDLNIRQCRSSIATSNASISTIYVAIQSVREMEQGLSAGTKLKNDDMTKAMIKSSAESLNVKTTLRKSVEDQILAYQSLLTLMGDILPKLGELFLNKVWNSLTIIDADPNISGPKIASSTYTTPGIAATGGAMVQIHQKVPERVPAQMSNLSSPCPPPRSPISNQNHKVVGSLYMKPPGRSEPCSGNRRRH